MRIVKKFFRDDKTELVSKIFDEVLIEADLHLPFEKVEMHVRDKTASFVSGEDAVVSINYNDPLILEKDRKGIRTVLLRELFRLMFKFDLPQPIEDVIIGRELIKRGFGDDLCYMYYNYIVMSKAEALEDYININLPWIIFCKDDRYNSELFKQIASKICKRKYPECQRFFDLLIGLSGKNLYQAKKEYESLFGC